MAVSENPIVGVDLKLQYDATADGTDNPVLIGTQTDGSLSVSPDIRDIILKNTEDGSPTDWKDRIAGNREWEVSHEGLLLNNSSEYKISTDNAKLELVDVQVDTDDDGTDETTTLEIPRLDSIDFTLTQELAETGGLDRELWTYYRPAEREYSLDISGSWLDPNSNLGQVYEPVLERLLGSQSAVTMKLTVMGEKIFKGDVLIGDYSLDASTGGEDATVELTLPSKGELTNPSGSTAFDSSIDNIFDAWMNKREIDVGMVHYNGDSERTGSTKLSGSGFFSEVSISLSDGEEATVSSTIQGNGALSKSTV
jgi:predicted secreted protein